MRLTPELRDGIIHKILTIYEIRHQVSDAEIVLLVRGARGLDWSDRPDVARRLEELNTAMFDRHIATIFAPLEGLSMPKKGDAS